MWTEVAEELTRLIFVDSEGGNGIYSRMKVQQTGALGFGFKKEKGWGKAERQKLKHPLILYNLWLVLMTSVHSYRLKSDADLILSWGFSEKQRCFLVLRAAVEKAIETIHGSCSSTSLKPRYGGTSRRNSSFKPLLPWFLLSVIPANTTVQQHRQQNVKLLHYLSVNVLVTKRKLSESFAEVRLLPWLMCLWPTYTDFAHFCK